MNGPAVFGHVADYSSTTSIIAFVLIAVAILFIYLYNSLSMRRSQLDRQLAHIRIILKRRAELARQLAPDLPEFPFSAPIAEQLRMDTEAAAVVKELQEPDPEPLTEYNELEKTLDDTIGPCRVSLEQYNRIVENPDANWAMRLFRFEPRERF
ncbi:hypothetical protein KH017_15725 [bacterium]|nr:hypothetical protein [bacterium]